ncbi:MAG: bicyclomycin/multidrug efflux system [Methanosaeta sp. PtaU1.Bin112]|nr:MAG: bicyclomycin/multidrug efflux system [Methanosaeta sp. PtaU1.Bin112]
MKQKFLGEKGLIGLIAFLSAFVPLSTDLYLPALPGMAKFFGVSTDQANLTLILFFVFFAAGTLFWGPQSDRYGRRPILLIALSIYSVAGFLCAGSADIYQLILFRILQALGGSGAFAVATAIIKDVYDSRNRETILALVQSMVLISPMAAPVLGALLLTITSWRGVFLILGGIGLVALAGSFALQETAERCQPDTAGQALRSLAKVAKNPGFASLLLIFSLLSLSGMAFIASSSYIYINGFGLSEQIYSYYFAFNALGMMAGPVIYLRLARRISRRSIIPFGFVAISASGILIALLASASPQIFALVLLPATIMSSCIRTPGANLMLEQQDEDTGSASALMSCFGILMGSVGMTIISLPWGNTISILGMMNILVGLTCLILWQLLSNKPFIKQIPENMAMVTH